MTPQNRKNFFDWIEKVSDCTRKGGSPPPFHTFPPLPIQRVFSFFDTLRRGMELHAATSFYII